MMLRYSFKLVKEADAVERACEKALKDDYLTADLVGSDRARTTSAVGDYIAKAVG